MKNLNQHPYYNDALILNEVFNKFPHLDNFAFSYYDGDKYDLPQDGGTLWEISGESVNLGYILHSQENSEIADDCKSLLVEIGFTVENLVAMQAILRKLSKEFCYAYKEETITRSEISKFLK